MSEAINTYTTVLEAETMRFEQQIAAANRKIEELGKKGQVSSEKVGAGASGMGQRYANATLQISQATETIARQGKVAGETAKQLLNQAGQMAFAFGAGGAIAGAVAITTLAIVQMFTRARREMEETARKFDEELANMMRSRDIMGISATRQRLYSGDAYALPDKDKGESDQSTAFLVRQRGLRWAEAEKRRIDALLKAREDAERQQLRNGAAVPMDENAAGSLAVAARGLDELKSKQKELNDLLPEMRREYDEASKGIEEVVKHYEELGRTRQRRLKDEDLAAAAKKDANEAARELKKFQKDAEEVERTIGRIDVDKILKNAGDEARGFTLEMEALAAEMTPTLVDDMTVALKQLEIELQKKGVGETRIKEIRKWKESLIEAQSTSEEFTAAMAKMQAAAKTGVLKPMGEMAELSQWESRIRAQIAALGTAKETEAARKALGEQLNAIEKRRGELIAENTKRIDDATSASERMRQKTEHIARGVHDALSAAYGLAEAFGVADSELGKLLRGVDQLAEGVARIAAGDVVGGGLQAVGALTSIVGNLVSDPDHDEKVRAQQANTEALRKLTDGLTALAGVGGMTVTRAAPFVDAIVRASAGASFRSKVYGIDELGPLAYPAIKAAADALGITLDGTVDSFRKLQQAINEARAQMAEFGGSFTEQRAQWEAYQRIFGEQGALQQLTWLATAAGNQAPALQQLFAGLNLSASGDRDALRKRVQDLFTTMMAGGEKLDASAMGGLSRDEFLQVLGEVIGALDALAPKAKSAAEQLRDALGTIDAGLEIMDVTDPAEQLQQRAVAYQALGGSIGQLFEGLDLSDPAAVAELDARVRALFKQLQESPDSVDLAGLSIEELIAVLLELDSAADAVAAGVKTAADAFNQAVGQLDIDREIYGTEDPTSYAQGVAGAAGASFTEIERALAGIDLSTEAGREKARKALQDLYSGNKDNAPLVGAIRSVIRALNAVPGAAPVEAARAPIARQGGTESIANAARGITEAAGNRMADYLRAIQINTSDLVRLAGGRGGGAIFPMLPTPLVPPYVPTRGGAGSGGGGGAVNVQLFLTVEAPSGVDPRAWGQALGQEAALLINQELAPWFDAALKRNGNLDRPGVS